MTEPEHERKTRTESENGGTIATQDPARPTFSVIIPTYNRRDLVGAAVDSVLAQTVTSYELIVVDDGSTDRTDELLAPYGDRLRYIYQQNGGIAAARNRGIREARGEFLAFLDSDDCFEPRLLEAVHAIFEAHPDVGAVFSAEREIDLTGRQSERVLTKKSPGSYFTTESLIATDHRVGAGRPPVVRRHWVEQLGGFDESLGCAVDCEMWIRYSFHMPMLLQPEPLVLRRVHGSNISQNQKQDAEDWLQLLDWLKREHPEFVRRHRKIYRRMLGKHHLRRGREILARAGSDPQALREARRALRDARKAYPRFARAYLYLVWSYVAPSTYGSFRRWELERGAGRHTPEP